MASLQRSPHSRALAHNAAENWEVKGKFPPSIKPVLAEVALKAIKLNEYNDNFFNLMPRLFPYNRFTMSVSGAQLSSLSQDPCSQSNRN